MKQTAKFLAGLASIFWLAACASASVQLDEKSLEAKAWELHAKILTVDTHCDTAMGMTRPNWDIGERHETGKPGSGLIDLPRMKEGGLDALFFGCFVGQGERTPEGYARAKSRILTMLEAVDNMCAKYPNLVAKATTPADAYRIKKEGKRVAFIGIENGYAIGKDLSLIGQYAMRGVRYLTLVHSADNDICASATDRSSPEDEGLSDFGREVVVECNRQGVMIDVSHMSEKAFYDVLKSTKSPIFASHSCSRAVCDSPRNLTDDQLRALAKNGGVLQICFLSSYLKTPKPNLQRDKALKELEAKYGSQRNIRNIQDEATRNQAMQEFQAIRRKYPDERGTVKDIVDHFDHVIKVVGVDYAGVGTDFDGGGGVADCADVSQMYRVTVEMLRRGYSETDIRKIWGGNIMRVLQKVIESAQK